MITSNAELQNEDEAVFLRITGAALRAVLVAIMVMLPAFILPGVTQSGLEFTRILATVAAAFVIYEYGFLTPSVIEFRDAAGLEIAVIPEISAEISAIDMLKGNLRPVSIILKQAHFHLKRDAAGMIDISVGSKDQLSGFQERGSLGDILASVEKNFDLPVLNRLRKIVTKNSRVTIEDAWSGRTWQFRDGLISFVTNEKELLGTVNFTLDNPGKSPSRATFSWRKVRGEATSKFRTQFAGFQTNDLADQVVAFDWLRVLDAPISGSFSVAVGADGSFGQMSGVLDVGKGQIRQGAKVRPLKFSVAKAYVSFDPKNQKITFGQISVKADAGEFQADGQAYLHDLTGRSVGSVVAQLHFSKIKINPIGAFKAPVRFKTGFLDMRLRLAPLGVDIGQMVLNDDAGTYVAKGRFDAQGQGWKTDLKLRIDKVSRDRVLALWPLAYKKKTRVWLVKNALGGTVQNVTGVVRGNPGEKPEVTLEFDVSHLDVKFMKTMPPIEGGEGYGVLRDNKMTMVLERGTVGAPDGGRINVAGSSMVISDVRIKKSPAIVALKTQSSLTSLLTLLDLKPFEFLSKTGIATDVATGNVRTEGTISFPLSDKVTFDQVKLAVSGDILAAKSDKLVKGKVLSAAHLTAFVDNQGLTVSGQAKVGKLPVSGNWRQPFGPKHKGTSRIEAQVELSPKFLDEFHIGLPKGSLKGKGTARVVIDIKRAQAPSFLLVSDLNRLRLAIDPLGWVKPKSKTGRLTVKGSFGAPPKIDVIELSAKGMDAKGSITLNADGTLKLARFDKVDIDGWMRTPVEIRTDENGNAAFVLTSGTIDFRRSRFSSGAYIKGSEGNKITARLDKLILSSGIVLTDIKGDLTSARGVSGSFSGKVNGGTRIVGTIAPHKGGTAVRFTSNDAGGVLRSAGVFSSAVGGRLDMVLVPSDKQGEYNGTLRVQKTRVKGASALAELLSAISVVGLLEQLSSEGIAFTNMDAKFRLTPTGVVVKRSSATGASMGLTMQGNYGFSSQKINMQGVITPVYLLNGILEQTKIFGGLFGKQKGEGLFGFNYTLKGNVDAPKVGVNPLSILTPGLLRELFHRPIPEKTP